MKVTLVETFANALVSTPSGDVILSAVERGDIERALRALIEKHIGPLLVEAKRSGELSTLDSETPEDYARRIISDLTAPPEVKR